MCDMIKSKKVKKLDNLQSPFETLHTSIKTVRSAPKSESDRYHKRPD